MYDCTYGPFHESGVKFGIARLWKKLFSYRKVAATENKMPIKKNLKALVSVCVLKQRLGL